MKSEPPLAAAKESLNAEMAVHAACIRPPRARRAVSDSRKEAVILRMRASLDLARKFLGGLDSLLRGRPLCLGRRSDSCDRRIARRDL